jgi:uncharacterized phage protein gp47/JayE
MSPKDIRNAYLRVVRTELIRKGVPNPNVTPKSDYAVKATALAQMLSPCMANAVAAAEMNMPDTASGDRLMRWLAAYGISFRAAQGSIGNVVFRTASDSFVAVGQQLVDDQGQFYEVTTSGTYHNGSLIEIRAVNTGVSTNRIEGTVLQWLSPPTYAYPKALVAVGGLADGANADTEAIARRRLLAKLAHSEGGGNWAETIAWAENVVAGTTVFDYPALNGPATYGLWALGQLRWTGTQFSRQISDAARTQIANAVRAKKPAEAQLTMPMLGSNPTIVDQPTDVSITLALPAAVAAGGPGGGWTDAHPWPALMNATATRVMVATITDSTHIRVYADHSSTPDPAGIVNNHTQIAWFDPSQYGVPEGKVIRTSTIIGHSGPAGLVDLVLDPSEPFAGIQVGDFIFPDCERAEEYAQAWLAAMGQMGPGEWTDNATVLAYARRQPSSLTTAPSGITYVQRKAIEQSGTEVLSADHLYELYPIPFMSASTITATPWTLVPGRRLAFYPPATV